MKKILLISICLLTLFTGCLKNEKETANNDIEVKINRIEPLSLAYEITSNNDMIITITNDGNEIIDNIDIDIAFFDNEDNLIRVEKQYIRNIIANGNNIIKFSLTQIDANGENSELPSRVEVALNKTIYSTKFETVFSDKISSDIEKSDVGGQLDLVVTNNSGVTIDDLNAVVVFYKDSKIIDIYVANMQNVTNTMTHTVYIPTTVKDGKVTYIEYDDIKTVINNATKYNTEA